jgi:signal transduction histidine kinase
MEIMPQVGIQLGHVYERNRLEREVALVADREQQRMGQEMHDGLSQQIAGISMLAGSLAGNLKAADGTLTEEAERLVSAIEDAKEQARALSKGLLLVNIDAKALRLALEELAELTTRTYDIECSFECSDPLPGMESFTATHLYRIAREAVHNAVKHAKAKRIWIRLENGAQLTLAVRDDGAGIDASRAIEGDGVRIMRHRAELIGATFSMQRAEEGGTAATCVIER